MGSLLIDLDNATLTLASKSGTFKAKPSKFFASYNLSQGGLARLENQSVQSNIHPLSPVEIDAECQIHCSDVPPAEGDEQVINRSLKVTRPLPFLMEWAGLCETWVGAYLP